MQGLAMQRRVRHGDRYCPGRARRSWQSVLIRPGRKAAQDAAASAQEAHRLRRVAVSSRCVGCDRGRDNIGQAAVEATGSTCGHRRKQMMSWRQSHAMMAIALADCLAKTKFVLADKPG
jgi:hypothetical protein